MAETAVAVVVEQLVKLLTEEATILRGVQKEVKGIKDRLKEINSYIKDAEKKQVNEKVRDWLNSLRKVAFEMEDVVDHYLLKVAARGQRHGVYGALTKVGRKVKTLTHRHDIACEITDIRKSLDDLYSQRIGLGLQPSESASGSASAPNHVTPTRLAAHLTEESQLVGIDRHKRQLTYWLTQRQCPVMVVVGSGGIGKTTIVSNVYHKQEQVGLQKKKNNEETSYFEFCAWITMSRPQVEDDNVLIRKIVENILEKDPGASATLQRETKDLVSLTKKLKEYLTDKRYLIVFDDVQDSKFWNCIKHVLIPNSSKSRKVVIITRNENVAELIIGGDAFVEVHKVEPLSPDDALKLFRQKAFQQYEPRQFPELNDLSKEFVNKCNWVPLAIVAIAGLLSTKKKTNCEWQKVLDQLGSLLQKNSLLDIVNQVMLESYYDLPSYLKSCFLYFGLFPEGHSISCMRLVRLWVAEGFVEERETEDTSMEDLAEEYLAELVRRCLVHVSRVDFDGRPKSCHVYDLMHKLIARICKEQMFCQVMKHKITQPNSELDSAPRRLSIIKNTYDAIMIRSERWKTVRSCFVFDDAKKWLVTEKLFSSFELLIALDLSNARLDNLPEQVGNLLNLKYLSLRNTNIKSLPESIGNLENLQTLDLKLTQVHELPMEIKNLVKLCHLLAYYLCNHYSGLDRLQGVKLNKGLKNLVSLQKLSFLDAGNGSVIKELRQLRKLRKLGIIKLKKEHGEILCEAIENMTHLSSLSIGAMGNHGILQLQSLRNPPLSLQRLYLYGRLERLPNWISKLPNLIRLYLKWSDLKEDPLPYLKDLSELVYLELYDTYKGDELHFKNGWLKGLKVLYLEFLPKLKTIKIDEGAIPHLAELKIGKCHEMVRVPRDLKKLKSLRKLYLYDMHEEFINRMNETGSKDYSIINRIDLVEYSNGDHFAALHNPDS